ncbi:MAG: hypothetical protein AAF484_08920 [Pseudomonadota bacterium]
MNRTSDDPTPFRVVPLTTDDLEQSFELVTRVFVDGSTLHRALRIDLDLYRSYLRPSFDAMVAEGLSVMVVEPVSQRILGCLIVTAFAPPVGGANHRFAPLAALTSELVARYRQKRQLRPGEAALVDMGAVAPEVSGGGLYKAMRDRAHHTARKRGFRFVLGELSSAATQHVVLGRMGHRAMAKVAFAEFEYQGARPFASIKTPESLILSEGDLR